MFYFELWNFYIYVYFSSVNYQFYQFIYLAFIGAIFFLIILSLHKEINRVLNVFLSRVCNMHLNCANFFGILALPFFEVNTFLLIFMPKQQWDHLRGLEPQDPEMPVFPCEWDYLYFVLAPSGMQATQNLSKSEPAVPLRDIQTKIVV